MTIDDPHDPDKAAAEPGTADGSLEIQNEQARPQPPVAATGAEAPVDLAGSRKLAPPPKPATKNPFGAESPSSPGVARQRMIVVGGEPSQRASGGAAAWTRPLSDAPGPRSNPPPAVGQPSLDLRAKLGIGRPKSDSVRPPPAEPSQPSAAEPPVVLSVEAARPPAVEERSLSIEASRPPPPPVRVSSSPQRAGSDARGELSALAPPLGVAERSVPPRPLSGAAPPPPSSGAPVGRVSAPVVPSVSAAPPPPPARAPAPPPPPSARITTGEIEVVPESEPDPITIPPLAAQKDVDVAVDVDVEIEPPRAAPRKRTPVPAAAKVAAAPASPSGRHRAAPAVAAPPVESKTAAVEVDAAPTAPAAAKAASPSAASPTGVGSDPPAPPRPKSEPARLRGGPPRPRASSPGFSAARSPAPPRPSSDAPRGDGSEANALGGLPSPPRVPRFPLGAAPPRPEPGARRSEPPVTASAIAVMRIVAVGDPEREPVAELDDGLLEEPGGESPARASKEDELEEIAEEEVATLASGQAAPAPEASVEPSRDTPISIPPADILGGPPSPPMPAASLRDGEQPKPPPPPLRNKGKTPSLPKPVPQAKRRQKPPWWEDVFGEDFVRASLRLTDDQIRREVDFIEESLGVASGGVVLDLGCGAGHHAVELSSRGYGVVGYDLSLYQLALASDVAQERGQKLNFLQGDMREMAFEEMFDGIFSWNTSFGYFEEEKNLNVAERVFRALRPGGMFLIDVVNRDYVAVSSPCSMWYEGDSCVCMDDMNLDFITSRMRVKRSVILDDGRTRESVYSIRVYSLHELGKLLHDVGFRVTEASGLPQTPGVFFGENSPRIIVLAQKP